MTVKENTDWGLGASISRGSKASMVTLRWTACVTSSK